MSIKFQFSCVNEKISRWQETVDYIMPCQLSPQAKESGKEIQAQDLLDVKRPTLKVGPTPFTHGK